MEQLSDEQIKEIFLNIEEGFPHARGSFLTAFAKAVIRADGENFNLLKPTCEVLIDKYSLHIHLTNERKTE